MLRLVSGNEALALGALRAGVKVAAGYPGTPSTGALECLIEMQKSGSLEGRHVEWSVNEKVALEVCAGASWAGQRALCTMKMSGLNVAFDSLCSIAYSGCLGGLVIYVADDPGASAGMCEQDSRGFAYMSDLPMLEPASAAQAYSLVQTAFDLSERVGTPVLVRLVTAVAHSYAVVQIEGRDALPARDPVLVRDITKFTKAGAAICMSQHRDVIARLAQAERIIQEAGVNELALAPEPGGLGIVAVGTAAAYLEEGLGVVASSSGGTFKREETSVLRLGAVNPLPDDQIRALLQHSWSILVLEELEPYVERAVYVEAQKIGWQGRIIGKLDRVLSRIGEYGAGDVVRGVGAALDLTIPPGPVARDDSAERLAAQRPITVCAGCPHRGTFMAINRAIRKLKFKQDEILVTGDIGCTILGMNPPFNTVWTEISMGASIGLAQGYVWSGVKTPVIATIGDSTFFHAGIPALVNAIQQNISLTLIIMDNGWTAMTGMQENPGTRAGDSSTRPVDIARIVPALGVEQFFEADPFDFVGTADIIQKAMTLPGVKVVLCRQECAIPAMRRGDRIGKMRVVEENCNLCNLCIMITGCPAISIEGEVILIDQALCYGCGLCIDTCHRDAIVAEAIPEEAFA